MVFNWFAMTGAATDAALGVGDVLDIAVVAVVIYLAIMGLGRAGSRPGVLVIGLSASAYALVHAFDLQMAGLLLQGVLAVLLVSAVVVFQPEIRRLFDQVMRLPATYRWRALRRPGGMWQDVTEALTTVAERLVEQRQGGLMAVRGQESWDRLTEGGVPLDGRVSVPLLCTLFDPHTPAHDGAVLIDESQVTRFGVHLPLSRALPTQEGHGTRHAAALGLAEQTDALVIVVSEERGEISVARAGALTIMPSLDALRSELEQFGQSHGFAPARHSWPRAIIRQVVSITAAVALATAGWTMLSYVPAEVYRSYEVPIEFRGLEPRWMLSDPAQDDAMLPSRAHVTLVGTRPAFRMLNPDSLVVSLDLSQITDGPNAVSITEEDLTLPPGLELHDVRPQTLEIVAHEMVLVALPVRVETSGQLPDALQLGPVTATPDTVRLLLPRDAVDQVDAVHTEPIDLATLRETTARSAKLVFPEQGRVPPDTRAQVDVRINVQAAPAP